MNDPSTTEIVIEDLLKRMSEFDTLMRLHKELLDAHTDCLLTINMGLVDIQKQLDCISIKPNVTP